MILKTLARVEFNVWNILYNQRFARLFLCLACMIHQPSQWGHRCLMVGITNDRDGKHSKIWKAGSAVKLHETKPSSGRIKIHVLAWYSATLPKNIFLLIHTSMITRCCSVSPTWTITAEILNWDAAVKFVFRSELPLISGAFGLKILIYIKL